MVMVIKSNVPSNVISNPDGWNPPFNTAGMLYAGIYGRGSLSKNFARGGSDAIIIGSPEIVNHFAIFSSENFIDTGISNTKTGTLIVIAKRSAAPSRQYLISSYLGANKFGRSLVIGSGTEGLTQYSHYSGVNGSGASASVAFSTVIALNPLDGSPAFLYGKDSGKILTVGDSTASKKNSGAASGTMESFVSPELTYRIGRNRSTTESSGDNSVAAALIFDRALSDAEIADIYKYFKSYFSRRGINI